ncbi:MAG: HIT domain-containing protein [Pseudomonadota bacterium]
MSLTLNYNPDNIFAKIIAGDMPATKIWETDDILAFMDVFPQSDGHCLVVHKKAQAANLLDIDPQALGTLILGVKKVAAAVAAGLKPDGIRIAQFNGSSAGQTVFHLHFHIIPVYDNVPLSAHHGAAQDGPTPADILEPVAQKIVEAL